ncbi:MAG: helix-turn-helix domain-containing protein [Butyrivibrio sp.]|nr:helix-turn-helix domain-containing protein [Butyrivibrio sp.]
MDSKSTEELRHEIKAASDIEDYLQSNKDSLNICTLPEYLNIMLSQKGITKADVVRDSLMTRSYVYQIFSGEKTPFRDNLIAIAFGLHLSEDETQKMLKISKNRELYARDGRDAIILFALQRNQSVYEVNDLLFDHGFKVLGAMEK